MSTEVQRVTIELEPGDPIHGRLLDDAGTTHTFHGWLELSATLERAHRRGADEAQSAGRDFRAEAP